MKKILALAVALMMVLAVMAPALADGQNTNGTFNNSAASIGTLSGEAYTAGITSTTFNVHFDITGTDATRPKTQFSYSIANGSAVAATATTPAIYAGVTDGVTLPASAVTDAWDTVNSTEATDTIALAFDASKFSNAGIYRYILTETVLTDEQTAIGIVDGDTSNAHTANVLYLDVYVGKVDDALAVTGAVLFDNIEQPTLSDSNSNNTKDLATYSHKIDGFYNSYTSYSMTIKKTVTGAAGDQNEYFPFKLALLYTEPATGDDANTTICGQTVTVTATSNSTVGSSYAIGSTSGTANEYTDIKIKHDGTVTLTGLSKTAVVKLMETIAAGEGYRITSVVTGMTDSAAISSAVDSESDYATLGTVNGSVNADITYTNDRVAISPTGVVLRFAPYIVMVGIAAFLLVMAARRRKDTEDKSSSI